MKILVSVNNYPTKLLLVEEVRRVYAWRLFFISKLTLAISVDKT
jgi:hypothetical protein